MSPTTKRPRSIRQEIFNLPNSLTLGRILVIPFVVWAMWVDTRKSAFVATLLFAAAAITDFLDGWVARRQGLVSLWGKFLDPVADKLIVMATTVSLVHLRVTDTHSAWYGRSKLPLSMVVILLGREIAVTSLRAMAAREGFTIEVGQSGKWKTALQLVGLIGLLIGYTYPVDYLVWQGRMDFVVVGAALLGLSVFFSVVSGGQYLMEFLRCIGERENYEKRPKRERRTLLAGRRRRKMERKRGSKKRGRLFVAASSDGAAPTNEPPSDASH